MSVHIKDFVEMIRCTRINVQLVSWLDVLLPLALKNDIFSAKMVTLDQHLLLVSCKVQINIQKIQKP